MNVAPQRLMEIGKAVLVALGASPEEGARVAESLVEAEMRGIYPCPSVSAVLIAQVVFFLFRGWMQTANLIE